jgi:hypothetical protein
MLDQQKKLVMTTSQCHKEYRPKDYSQTCQWGILPFDQDGLQNTHFLETVSRTADI